MDRVRPTRARQTPASGVARRFVHIGTEAAGEVQTPLTGDAASNLVPGDRVWFRHTKSGEVCERARTVALIGRDQTGQARVDDLVPTYRGEEKCYL